MNLSVALGLLFVSLLLYMLVHFWGTKELCGESDGGGKKGGEGGIDRRICGQEAVQLRLTWC